MSICATCKHVRYCEIVENGYSSRVKSCKDYIPNKQTHFQQITASPEKLAEFINECEWFAERCAQGLLNCDKCECDWCGMAGRPELIDWLYQESE